MSNELQTPSYELWTEIVKTHRRFFVSDLERWVDGNFDEILRAARRRALNTNGIVISAFHCGQWYKVDVAYHPEHAA
jgi:hypothetical protein